MSHEVIFRKYRRGDEEGIVKVLRTCFPYYEKFGVDADYWLSYSRVDPGIRNGDSFVAEQDGEIVGNVQLLGRRIKVADSSFVSAGCIANVCTIPEMRGKGISTRLMSDALEACRQLGYPISCLFTDYGSAAQRIYGRLGYANTLMCETRYVGSAIDMQRVRERYENAGEVTVRNYEKGDEKGMLDVYREWIGSYTGVVERSSEYWQSKMVERSFSNTFFYEEFDPNEVFVGLKNGKVVSYACVTYWKNKHKPFRGRDDVSIRELVFSPDNNGSAAMLVGALMDRFLSEGAKLCEADLPMDEPYLSLLDPFKRMPLPGWSEGHLYMTHVTLLRELLEGIRGDLESRLSVTSSSRSDVVLALRTPYGEVMLRTKGGELSLDDGKPSSEVAFDADSFAKMIFGVETIETALRGGGVKIITSEPLSKIVSVLLALFPRRTWYTSPIDAW